MHKKSIWFVAILAMFIAVFSVTGTVSAADPDFGDFFGPTWDVKTLETPYYHGQLQMWPPIPAVYKMGSISSGHTFNDFQRHAVQPLGDWFMDDCGLPVDSYVRVRVQANGEWLPPVFDPIPNIIEGSVAVKIWLDVPGKPEVASGVSDQYGVIDIVGMIPAGETYGVTVGGLGAFVPFTPNWEFMFDVWVTQGLEPGGGVIIDFRQDDEGTATNRQVQFSTLADVEPGMAYWAEEPFAFSDSIPNWGAAQYWLDIPTGTYNVGVQQKNLPAGDRPGDPFVHYVPNVAIGEKAFFGPLGWNWIFNEWIDGNTIYARKGATLLQVLEVDSCGPNYGDVFLNLVDGFLVDDLSVGMLHDFRTLPFYMNTGFRWDLAVVKDWTVAHGAKPAGQPDNWFLVTLDFNAAAGDLKFELCKTGVQWIQTTTDADWDSTLLFLTPPGGNLNERIFDIIGRQNSYLYAKAGCCGTPGCFEAFVELGNLTDIPKPCCTDARRIEGEAPCDMTYYGFVPTKACWDEPLVKPWICPGCPGNTATYRPTFGNGPFVTEPALGQLKEFDVSKLNGDVMLARGNWYDAFGNQLVYIQENVCENVCPTACDLCLALGIDWQPNVVIVPFRVDLEPYYLVIENVTGNVVLEAEGWETTPLGPVTEIGRYMYVRGLPINYLNDITGHRRMQTVCCFEAPDPCDPCPNECLPGDLDTCEDPRTEYEYGWLFAISPADTPMAHWSWSWVMAMYEWDLTVGLTPTTYGPDVEMKRSEMAAFLSRVMTLFGVPAKGTSAPFADTVGHWAEANILHLRDYNITEGVGGNMYDPEKVVSRAEMAKFIQLTFRAINTYQPGTITHWDTNTNIFHPGSAFVDVPSNHWAHYWIEEMLYDGLTSGYTYDQGNWYYMPEMPVTRGQMAKFVISAIQTDEVTQGFWPVLAPEK